MSNSLSNHSSRRLFLKQAAAGTAAFYAGTQTGRIPAIAAERADEASRKITSGVPQIFVDLSDIEQMDNISQLFHTAEKHSDNPVIFAQHPWERAGGGPAASVIYDEQEKVFKCWYQGVLENLTTPDEHGYHHYGRATLNYAISQDGVHWERPKLRLHEVMGTMDNNVVVPPEHHGGKDHWESVQKDPFDPDPQRRYKAIGWSSYDPEAEGWCTSPGRCGIYSMTSPDGLNWTHTPEPIYHWRPRPGTDDLGPVGDAQSMMIDSKKQRYVGFFRSASNRVYGLSEDFVTWTPTQTALEPIPGQPGGSTLYNHVGFNYGDTYLGIVSYFHTLKDDPRHPQLVLRLLSSQDGLKYSFVGPNPRDREPIVGGGQIGQWDRFITQQTGAPPIRFGDKLHIYYRGFVRRHKPFGLHKGFMDSHEAGGIGLATMRVDGFSSLAAGFIKGQVTTTPIRFEGSSLRVNAKANHFARLQVEVLDEQNRPLTGYTAEDCVPMTEDSVDYKISWKDGRDLKQFSGRPVKLRFHLVNTRLYAYRVV